MVHGCRNSVLDKLVPGYYQRRDEDGTLCMSTCCNNVATEHYMAERLAVEDLVHWAKHYKVRLDACVLGVCARERHTLSPLIPLFGRTICHVD